MKLLIQLAMTFLALVCLANAIPAPQGHGHSSHGHHSHGHHSHGGYDSGSDREEDSVEEPKKERYSHRVAIPRNAPNKPTTKRPPPRSDSGRRKRQVCGDELVNWVMETCKNHGGVYNPSFLIRTISDGVEILREDSTIDVNDIDTETIMETERKRSEARKYHKELAEAIGSITANQEVYSHLRYRRNLSSHAPGKRALRRRARGIVEDCCHNRCELSEIEQYCHNPPSL